jgi:hypothetical protein
LRLRNPRSISSRSGQLGSSVGCDGVGGVAVSPWVDLTALGLGDPIDGAQKDPLDPPWEPFRVSQPANAAPRQDQRLLDGILRLVVVGQHELGHRVEPRDRRLGQDAERCAIAALCPLDQFALHLSSLLGERRYVRESANVIFVPKSRTTRLGTEVGTTQQAAVLFDPWKPPRS